MDISIPCSKCRNTIKGYGLIPDEIDHEKIIEDFEWTYDKNKAEYYCKDCKE